MTNEGTRPLGGAARSALRGEHASATLDIESGFAPDHEGARWIFTGSLNFANAGSVLAATRSLALPTEGEVDLGELTGIDSSAVAVLVALGRRAAEEGKPLRFTHVPAAVAALAQVYDVEWVLAA